MESTLIGALIQGGATVVAIPLAAYLAYRFACRQMALESQTRIELEHRGRRADALQQAWGLLRYMGDKESGYSVVRWVQAKKDGKGARPKQYFLNVANARHFVERALPEVFYGAYVGLYWEREVKDLLFEYHSTVFGLLLAVREAVDEGGQEVLIENEALVARLFEIYRCLNEALRREEGRVWGAGPNRV